jgi:RHS repeat-associated protein
VFIEERNNVWNTPYLFNAKELDEETGLYYYGARYYDPRISLWLSADPLQEKYPNVSTYTYTFQNPVKYIDPTGMEGDPPYLDGQTAHRVFTQAMRLRHIGDFRWKFDLTIAGIFNKNRPDAVYDDFNSAGVWELKPAAPSPSAPLAILEAQDYADQLNAYHKTDRFKVGISGGAPLPFEGSINVLDESSLRIFTFTIINPADGGIYWSEIKPEKEPVPSPVPIAMPKIDIRINLSPKQIENVVKTVTIGTAAAAVWQFLKNLPSKAGSLRTPIPIFFDQRILDMMEQQNRIWEDMQNGTGPGA